MKIIQPFKTEIDFQSGEFSPGRQFIQRRLSQMQGMYADGAETARILADEGDRLIYEVYAAALPEEEGHILHGTTRIYPGRVGAEYHMTKGHYHARREQGEVYLGLSGRGCLVMQNESGASHVIYMKAGTAAYVPPNWAHRTVNIGNDDFVFFAAWAGEAGHDYGAIEREGFRKLILMRGDQPQIIDNPKYG